MFKWRKLAFAFTSKVFHLDPNKLEKKIQKGNHLWSNAFLKVQSYLGGAKIWGIGSSSLLALIPKAFHFQNTDDFFWHGIDIISYILRLIAIGIFKHELWWNSKKNIQILWGNSVIIAMTTSCLLKSADYFYVKIKFRQKSLWSKRAGRSKWHLMLPFKR